MKEPLPMHIKDKVDVALKAAKPDSPDQKADVDIVRRAIQMPAKQIALNADGAGAKMNF